MSFDHASAWREFDFPKMKKHSFSEGYFEIFPTGKSYF